MTITLKQYAKLGKDGIREAKEMIRRIDTGKAAEILNKNVSQLSNEDVRALSNSLLKIKS